MSHFTYILQCSDGSFYTGYSTNPQKRVHQHNHSKKAARYTRARRPVKLVYQKKFDTLAQATKREAEIKTWTKEKKQQLIGKVIL